MRLVQLLEEIPRPAHASELLALTFERGVEVLDRRLVLAGGHQALAARLVGLARERVAIDRVVEIGDRLNIVALALIDEAARVVGLACLRIKPDRPIQIVERARIVAMRALETLPRPR